MAEHGLYVGGSFRSRERARAVAERCRLGGAHIASSWHDAPSVEGLSKDGLWEVAHRARTEMAGARGLLALSSHTEDERDVWMLVEAARSMGKYVLVLTTGPEPVLAHAPGLVVVEQELAMWAWVEAFATSWNRKVG